MKITEGDFKAFFTRLFKIFEKIGRYCVYGIFRVSRKNSASLNCEQTVMYDDKYVVQSIIR